MTFEVDRAETVVARRLAAGRAHARAALAADVWLFTHGGLKILADPAGCNYDVWARRPKVSRLGSDSAAGRLLACRRIRDWYGANR